MKEIILYLAFSVFISSCKDQTQSIKAFSEVRSSGPLDRIYLAVNDQSYRKDKSLGFLEDTNNILLPEYFRLTLQKNKELSYLNQLNSKLSVIACFNENRQPNACVPVNPKEKIFLQDDSNYDLRSKPNCRKNTTEVIQNSRYRYQDFPMSENLDIYDFVHFTELRRTGRCVELFKINEIGENFDELLKQSIKYQIQFGDKVRLALGASCIISGTASAVKHIPKILTVSKIPMVMELSKLVGTSKAAKALYNSLNVMASLDDYIIQLAKQITPQFRIEGAIILKRMLLKVVNLFSKYSMLSLAKSITLSPAASKIIAELNTSDIRGNLTLSEAIDILNGIEKENKEITNQIDAYVNSSIYKTMLKNIEETGLNKEELVYMGLTAATMWFPLVSCVTLARDINEVSNKVNKKNNLVNLYRAFQEAESEALKNISVLKDDKFNEIQSVYEDFQKASFLDQIKFENSNSPKAKFYKTSISIYQSMLNHYTAYFFNKGEFKKGFKHKSSFSFYGETEAFQLFVKEIAEVEKKLKSIYSLLLQESLNTKYKLVEFGANLRELNGTENLDFDDLQKQFNEVYKTNRYEN